MGFAAKVKRQCVRSSFLAVDPIFVAGISSDPLRYAKHDVDHAAIGAPTFDNPRKRKVGFFDAFVERGEQVAGGFRGVTAGKPKGIQRMFGMLCIGQFLEF